MGTCDLLRAPVLVIASFVVTDDTEISYLLKSISISLFQIDEEAPGKQRFYLFAFPYYEV